MMAAGRAEHDISVIGTGVVGLAAALGCAQAGLRVALVGPAPRLPVSNAETPFDVRIYALAGASIDLLSRVRAWSQVDAQRVQPVLRMQIEGDDGGSLSFDAYAAAVERLATIAEEAELLRALWLACGLTPALTHVDDAFEAMAVDDQAVHIRLASGTVLTTRLVLGADGKTSAVRVAGGFNAIVRPHHQIGVVANFACSEPHRGVAHQFFTEEGVVALLPLPGQHVSLVWSAPDALAGALLALSPGDLAARVDARTRHRLGSLTPLGRAHGFPLRDLRVDRTVERRVALLGDAAHVVHPLAGQGLNLGLQDVAQWLTVLREREAWRDPGDLVLLRRYERARAEPVGLMRLTVNGLSRLFGSADPATRWARNQGLNWVQALAPVKNLLIRRAIG